jgi:hypothetical protein
MIETNIGEGDGRKIYGRKRHGALEEQRFHEQRRE